MSEMVLLGRRSGGPGGGSRGADGRLRLSRHAVHRDPRVPDPARPHARRAQGRMVRQREDGVRSGPRRLLRRPAHDGDDEACGVERGGGPVHELGAGHRQRRPRRGGGGRPGHAQLSERAGQPRVRRLRARGLPRAGVAPGGVRDDAGGVRRLRALPCPRDDPPGDAPGPQPRHRGGRRGARREPAAQEPPVVGVGAAARQRAPPVESPARPLRRHPRVRVGLAVQFRRERQRETASGSSRPGSRAITSSRTSTTWRRGRPTCTSARIRIRSRRSARSSRRCSACSCSKRATPTSSARFGASCRRRTWRSRDASPARCRRTANSIPTSCGPPSGFRRGPACRSPGCRFPGGRRNCAPAARTATVSIPSRRCWRPSPTPSSRPTSAARRSARCRPTTPSRRASAWAHRSAWQRAPPTPAITPSSRSSATAPSCIPA